MESLLWAVRTFDSVTLATPVLLNLILCLAITQIDYVFLLGRALVAGVLGRPESFRPLGRGERPTGVVIIPSLLRNEDDLNAITTTIESASTNGYPSELYIIASVDGRTEFPALYARLEKWIAQYTYPSHVHVFAAGTPTRLGKMMAVEAGVTLMKRLVAEGKAPVFPEVYFSIDGDGTLGPSALERLVHRLTSRHPITGNMRRVVAGKICIRPDLVWRGWRALFTVEGAIYMNVAREFLVSNVSRFNWKPTPRIGIPGALYCTWAEILLTAPHYMGFMQSIKFADYVKWWFGAAPPRFDKAKAPSLPEALTGASDDTCMAFLASISSWRNGKLAFDAPRTPLHAAWRFIRGYFVERSHDYEPEARVFTYSPTTFKGLWKQRVRWNSSRVECAGRFWRAFWFHWEIGAPVSAHLLMLLHTVFEVGGYYVLLPYYLFGTTHAALGFVLGYFAQTVAYTLYTVMSLALERERRKYWRVMLCLPMASAYAIGINCFGCVYGVTRDIFLFGNSTNFAPEWTLMKGNCERVAILFRIRRAVSLAIRAVVRGDVPFGRFWFGWTETPWTPSGFEGWTTGKKPRSIFAMPGIVSAIEHAPITVDVVLPAPARVPDIALAPAPMAFEAQVVPDPFATAAPVAAPVTLSVAPAMAAMPPPAPVPALATVRPTTGSVIPFVPRAARPSRRPSTMPPPSQPGSGAEKRAA